MVWLQYKRVSESNRSLPNSSGTDVKTVSSALEHSQTSTTLDIHAHSFATKQAEASEAVANMLRIEKNAKNVNF